MKKRKRKEKITLESVEKHLQEKLKDPKFAKIYYAHKAKLKAKKRLEEILDEQLDFTEDRFDDIFITGKRETIIEILKEFVHKDSLPSAKKIADTIDKSYTESERKDLGKLIRKLIEGDRSV